MLDSAATLILSTIAVVVSVLSLFFARRSWFESNRPIVTAFITEHSSGNHGSTFDLVISNTGTRPAVNVRLHASTLHIRALLDMKAAEVKLDWMKVIFSNESRVPLLRNGECLKTSFGAYTPNTKGGEWLNYGAEIPITITYADVSGRRYEAMLPLKIYARDGFGGGVWSP